MSGVAESKASSNKGGLCVVQNRTSHDTPKGRIEVRPYQLDKLEFNEYIYLNSLAYRRSVSPP